MLGFIPVVGYQGTILPAFVAGFLGAKIERGICKRVPETLDLLITPSTILLTMSILSLFVIGLIFHSLEIVLLDATVCILGLSFELAGLVIRALNQLIVVTGIHHLFSFLEIQLLANTGVNPYNGINTASCNTREILINNSYENQIKKNKSISLSIYCICFLRYYRNITLPE